MSINLREISRPIGCAASNVYNDFSSGEDLMGAAFRKTILACASAIARALDAPLSAHEYFRTLLQKIINWPLKDQGLHQFITSDPPDAPLIPKDIVETVAHIGCRLFDTPTSSAGID